jgi:hypothetical protein
VSTLFGGDDIFGCDLGGLAGWPGLASPSNFVVQRNWEALLLSMKDIGT